MCICASVHFFFCRFSTDEGQCWHVFNFTKDPIYFTGLASEPGARSMNVSIWGYQESFLSQYWVSITIDFRELLTRDCKYALLEIMLIKNQEPCIYIYIYIY